MHMELQKDRAGDPVLPVCKESLKNPPHALKLWAGRAAQIQQLWAGRQWQCLGCPSIEEEILLTEAGKAISALSH